MLTPTVANHHSFFYAIGNTPATNLARSIPHGQDASILSLGCGDLRNILYTAYIEDGLPKRKLDVSACDIDEKIIGRNVLFLSLVIDKSKNISNSSLWDIYYHLYVTEATAGLLKDQAKKLSRYLESEQSWESSPYGSVIKFCDVDTRDDIRRICQRMARTVSETDLSQSLEVSKKHLKGQGDQAVVYTGVRSAGPLSLQALNALPEAHRQFWEDGTTKPRQKDEKTPNPMFAPLLSRREALHYGSEPLMGFHLATAWAPLAENSPLKLSGAEEEGPSHVIAAKVQFSEWVSALKKLITKGLVIRYAVSDLYAFLHTLQAAEGSSKLSANWYRRPWDAKSMKLDSKAYGKNGKAPVLFDTIDTSNLADHFGILNVLISAAPLLTNQPWATLYTELLIKREGTEEETFSKLLCGPAETISLLLGLSPVQFWTNAKAESHVDELYLALLAGQSNNDTQLHSRLTWKRDNQFSGYPDSRGSLHFGPEALKKILFQVYLEMFQTENVELGKNLHSRSAAYPCFHRGSFAAFLKFIKHRVTTDWKQVFSTLVDDIGRDQTLAFSTNFAQELGCSLYAYDVITEPWLLNPPNSNPDKGGLEGWKDIPQVVSVTIVVPRTSFDRLFSTTTHGQMASPIILGQLKAPPQAAKQWLNMYSDVQIAFGSVKQTGTSDSGDPILEIEQDNLGWEGSSSLIASFSVPTSALQLEPERAVVGLTVAMTPQSTAFYSRILGKSMTIFDTTLDNKSAVYLSKFRPGLSGHPIVCGGVTPFNETTSSSSGNATTKLVVDIPASESRLRNLTGRIDFITQTGKKLLKDKVPIDLLQTDPFVIEILFDDKDGYAVEFPVPVSQAGIRSRVARTTGYIEVIVPLANPLTTGWLADFLFPSRLSSSGLPVALNSPYINLDKLPVFDLSKKDGMSWLTTLTSFQFSSRERVIRDRRDDSGISFDLQVNFKESLLTMFMLASGLQGGQTGLFAIDHPDQGGIHMLIFVSAIRLDGDTSSVVLDAAVLPFTDELIESKRIETFLLILRELECCSILVNDEELDLWKKLLPAFVERCRTWSHGPKCQYKRKGSTVPLSLDKGEEVLCTCGKGHLPDNYMAIPEWKMASREAYRMAISPTCSVPFVEEVADMSTFSKAGGPTSTQERCRTCGQTQAQGGGVLKKCMRCQEAKYCSADCQKKDWKTHRQECKETK